MTPSRPNAQSPTERRAAEAEVRALVARHASAHHRLIGTMRRRLQKRLPTAHELVYEYASWLVFSYSPTEQGFQGVLAIRADAEEVKLYFNRSKGLSDPDKLLRGSASQVRWIPVEGAATLARPAVIGLIEGAIAGTSVPFPRTGHGPVVIRSSAAKKRGKAAAAPRGRGRR